MIKFISFLLIMFTFTIWANNKPKPKRKNSNNKINNEKSKKIRIDKIDHEPTEDEKRNFLKKLIDKEKKRKAKIEDRKLRRNKKPTLEEIESGVNTKSASDYDYLKGYNLTYANFDNPSDEDYYGDYFYDNYFIPQGLSKDKNGYLLISMYDIKKIENSIIVRYNVEENTIMNVYPLFHIDNNSNFFIPKGGHVGGIGYYNTYSSPDKEFIFVADGKEIQVYTPSSNFSYLLHVKSIPTKYWNSAMSTSNGYLWSAYYIDKDDSEYNPDKLYLTGYKIKWNGYYDISLGTIDSTGNVIYDSNGDVIPNYDLLQPKSNIQGLYCDSDPRFEKRLKFYFVRSGTYVYQAILESKDVDNNGRISGSNEYYWETFFTPYGEDSGIGRELPQGGEGIVRKNGKLFMLNEGATAHYCDKWWFNKDCAREILIVDPVYYYDSPYTVFKNGSIFLGAVGIEDYGHKVAIVFAQNKYRQLYYSIGEFKCSDNSNGCYMFTNLPFRPNPKGKTYSYDNKRPTVYVEDIIGIYLMNLDEYGTTNSDDFTLLSYGITFDDNYWLTGNDEEENITRWLVEDFGDSQSSDKKEMESYFQFKNGSNWDRGIEYFSFDPDSDVYSELATCYASPYISYHQCLVEALDNMEEYIDNWSWWFLYYRINRWIDRLYNVIL